MESQPSHNPKMPDNESEPAIRNISHELTKLIESLAETSESRKDLVAEHYFIRLGALDKLKSSGLLPPADPNPYNIDEQPDKYAQWWNEHQDIDPWEWQQKYEETLTYMYIGARIGFLAGNRLDQVPLQRIDSDSDVDA